MYYICAEALSVHPHPTDHLPEKMAASAAANVRASFCGSFSFAHYLQSLSQTPHRLRKRMLATWTPEQELNQVRLRSGADMKRKLRWYDLTALGVAGMLGAGVFVTTGRVAHSVSGPSVFISYLIAAVSALLSSLCYAEFSVQVPVAGGAFSYLRVTFGMFSSLPENLLFSSISSSYVALKFFFPTEKIYYEGIEKYLMKIYINYINNIIVSNFLLFFSPS